MAPLDPSSEQGKDKKDADGRSDAAEKQAEMEANYPYFRQFVYDKVREMFDASVPELPDIDLETLARLEGAEPLESFIDQLEPNGQGLGDDR